MGSAAASVDVALQEKNQLKTLNIFVKMTSRILSLISLTIVVLIFTIDGGPPVVQAHGHSHDAEPNPAFKYSRAANEKIQEDEILEEDIIDLPPQRGPSSGHGHSHGGHGHSHGGHGHSHGGHGHSHGGHGHSHGGHGHSHGHGHVQPELTPEQREKAREKLHKNWDDDEDECCGGTGSGSTFWNAILATLLISAAPFFILFFIPLDNSAENQPLLKVTLAFASGGLLGDAFLHLIPHAMMASGDGDDSGHGHSHSHGHSHGDGEAHEPHDLSVGLWTLAGIIAFLCVEKLVRIYSGGHSHSHAAPAVAPSEDKKVEEKVEKKEEKVEEKEEKKEEKEAEKEEKKEDDKKEDEPKTEENAALPEEKEIKVAGYLNLAADAFHNFTDGLAIGASFMAGNAVGFTTTFSILFHEIPHEIGDYAILIQSGVPPLKAIFLQSFTALAALAGCLVALFAHGAGQAAAAGIILPFTAGGFIYIATVSVIPELLEGTSLMQSIKEIVALLAGVMMMVIISWYE